MKITVFKKIYVRSKILQSEDIIIYRKYNFDFVPPIGATIENEKIISMDITKTGLINIYVEPDKYFYDVYDVEQIENIEQPQMEMHKNELMKYINKVFLSRGWKLHKEKKNIKKIKK